uniref:protein BTG3-like isoform X2 n=1 Tax=Myxine glutinosa TaxID=7769 RepID=UPI00358EF5FA
MKEEVAAAVCLIGRLVRRGGRIEPEFVERFCAALEDALRARCIRLNGHHRADPTLLAACRESGVPYADLALPREITVWVDPAEVCCRYSEGSYAFTVVRFDTMVDREEAARRTERATCYAAGEVSPSKVSSSPSSSSDENGERMDSPSPLGRSRCRWNRSSPAPAMATFQPARVLFRPISLWPSFSQYQAAIIAAPPLHRFVPVVHLKNKENVGKWRRPRVLEAPGVS